MRIIGFKKCRFSSLRVTAESHFAAMKSINLYILGAGCSANYDYPLAKDFRGTLKEYRRTLDRRPNCARLIQCVTNTVSMMERFNSPTIDRFVLQILEELGRQKRPLSPYDGIKHEKLEQSADCQIRDAKWATAALFLDREDNARKNGLQGYRDFLNIIFQGNRNPSALESTPSRVLSFNYERLYEFAFIDYFRLDSGMDCYGQAWLNSAFDFNWRKALSISPNRFCFLKLHGNAGTSVASQHGESVYECVTLDNSNLIIDDNFFWPTNRRISPRRSQNPEPLIVFPCEKDHAREGCTSFVYDTYIRTIWGGAMQFAQEAKQIWVIGYSFDPNDRKSLMELLRWNKASCEIVIWNPNAEVICNELRLFYPDLAPRLKPLARSF